MGGIDHFTRNILKNLSITKPEPPAFIDWNQIDSMDFPERIKTLIRLASAYDPNNAVHGAMRHKYHLNSPVTLADVLEFEQEFHVTIPEIFVRFLTEVGNGGAGVDYGFYSLETLRRENKHLKYPRDNDKNIFDYDNLKERWEELAHELDDALEACEEDSEIDKIYGKMYGGLLVIATNGCTFDHVLICEGKHTGMVGMIDWNSEEQSVPFFYGMDFETWICTYFKKIIQGDVTKGSPKFWTVNWR